MSWRRVQVTGLENADDALFCGLEEIDYNDYLKLRNNKALIEDIHIGGGESEVPIPTATFEQAIGEDEMNDEVELQNSNRKRKRKGQKVQQERWKRWMQILKRQHLLLQLQRTKERSGNYHQKEIMLQIQKKYEGKRQKKNLKGKNRRRLKKRR